jgi:hypothetical protein
MARAEFTVRAPVRACACSERAGSMADTFNTAINLQCRIGAPEQLKFTCRDLKCWLLCTVTGRSSVMHVPMPFVPSTSSDQTPPSQTPQYSNWLASAASPRCSTATPAVSQNKMPYPALRTTLYRRSISSCALNVRLPSGSRKCFSSPAVRTRGAVLSAGSILYVFAERCQELRHSSLRGARARAYVRDLLKMRELLHVGHRRSSICNRVDSRSASCAASRINVAGRSHLPITQPGL